MHFTYTHIGMFYFRFTYPLISTFYLHYGWIIPLCLMVKSLKQQSLSPVLAVFGWIVKSWSLIILIALGSITPFTWYVTLVAGVTIWFITVKGHGQNNNFCFIRCAEVTMWNILVANRQSKLSRRSTSHFALLQIPLRVSTCLKDMCEWNILKFQRYCQLNLCFGQVFKTNIKKHITPYMSFSHWSVD